MKSLPNNEKQPMHIIEVWRSYIDTFYFEYDYNDYIENKISDKYTITIFKIRLK